MLGHAAWQNIIALYHHAHLPLPVRQIPLHLDSKRERTHIRYNNIP